MSATIDDRIVSLEFDNNQFEKAVQETLNLLEKLKASLKIDDAAKNLSAISDAGKQVDLSSIGDSIDNLTEKFSTLRIAGLMALSHLVDGAFELAKKIGNILMTPINQMKTGGWNRAMNIENAKFQLEGLGVAWEELYEDIDYAVAGTAYGLDEAAAAAAQFSASQVKAGDDMKAALRGISGVAAMTNTTYGEMADIFTTVAGNGKATANELNRIGQRGLNARAALKDYFNGINDGSIEATESIRQSVKEITGGLQVTETEIRDFTSDGVISFELFSHAMDSAFGEHAKAANETFSGALANVKAALNKIGEKFATPLIHSAIPLLNEVRLMINAIKDNMGDVFTLAERVITVVGDVLTKKVAAVKDFINNDFSGMKNFVNGLYVFMISIVRIVNTIREAFATVFTGSLGDHVNSMAEGFERVAIALQPTERGLSGFKTVLVVVFRLVKMVGTVIGWLARNIAGPLLSALFKVIDVTFRIISRIMDIISYIGSLISQLGIFNGALSKTGKIGDDASKKTSALGKAFNTVAEFVSKAAAVIGTAVKTILAVIGTIVATPIYLLYQGFQKLMTLDWSKFVAALTNAKELVIEFVERLKELPIIQGIIEGLQTAFVVLVGGIMYFGEKVAEAFNKLAAGEVTIDSIKTKLLSLPDTFRAIGEKIKSFFSGNGILSSVGAGLGMLLEKVKGFVVNIKKYLEGLSPAKVMLITFAGVIMMLAINANSLLWTFNKTLGEVWAYFKLFANLNNPLTKIKNFVMSLGKALLYLAVALNVMANIPNGKLKEAATTMLTLMGAMTAMYAITTLVGKIGGSEGSFIVFGRSMALLAIGLLAAAKAFDIIAHTDFTDIWKKIGIFSLILLEVVGATALLGVIGPGMLSSLAGFLGAAIMMLAIGHVLKQLDQVDLTALRGSWKELTVVIVGFALLAKALGGVTGNLSIAILGFIIASKIIVSYLDELSVIAANITAKTDSIMDSVKMIMSRIVLKFKELFAEFSSFFSDPSHAWIILGAAVIITAAIIAKIIMAIAKMTKAIGAGTAAIAKEGKYIGKAGRAFALVAAALAGLLILSHYIAGWIKESPKEYMMAVGIIAGLMVAIGLLSLMCKEIDSKTKDGALERTYKSDSLKQIKNILVALGVVMLSMAAFADIMGRMTPAEFEQARKSVSAALVAVGAIVVLAEVVGNRAGDGRATFGHFAGLTLLLGAILGAIAILMINIHSEEEMWKLVAIVGIMGVLLLAIGGMFELIGRAKSDNGAKTALALAGGVAIIGAAIVLLAQQLPDEGYLKKIITVAGVMGAVFLALITATLIFAKLSHSKGFKSTIRSEKTMDQFVNTFMKLGLMFAGLAVTVGLLEHFGGKADRLLAVAGSIMAVMGAFLAIIAILIPISSKATAIKKVIPVMEDLTKMFIALAATVFILEKFGGTADRMLATSQTIVLLLGEFVGMMGIFTAMSSKMAAIKKGTAIMAAFTTMFVVLAATVGILEHFGGTADRMIATSQVVVLLLGEFVGITALLTILGTKSLSAMAALPTIAILSLIFAALAGVIVVLEGVSGKADRMLATSQVVMLVLVELIGITGLIAALIAGTGGIGAGALVASMAVLPTLVGLTVIFAALALVIAVLEKVGGKADRMLAVSQVIVLVLLELSIIVGILGIVGLGAITATMAIPALAALVVCFGILSICIATLKSIDATDAKAKVDLITDILWSMVGMLAVFSLLTLGTIGMLAGAASMIAIVAAIVGLCAALKMLEPLSYQSISKGLTAVATALQMLLYAGAAAALLAPGLLTLGTSVTLLGIGCLAAGAGVLLFASGIEKLATTTPSRLMMLESVIRGFFASIGQGIAAGIQAIIRVVVDGIKILKATAVNEARGFVPDLIKALFNTGGAEQAAAEAGKKVGNSWIQGFRNSKLQWHSPPWSIAVEFARDVASAIKDNKTINQAFSEAGEKAGNNFQEYLTDTLGKYDIGSVGSSMGGDLMNMFNISLSDGLDTSSTMLDRFLNYYSHSMTSLNRGFSTTIENYRYQLNTELTMAKREMEKWDSYSSGTSTNSYYTTGYAAKKYAETKAEVDRLEESLNGLDGAATSVNETLETGTDILSGYGGAGGSAKNQIQEFHESLQQTLESQMNIFDKFEAKAAMSKEELLSNMKSQIDGMTSWATNMDKLSTMGIDKGLYQKLAEMGPQGAQYVGAFASMTAEEMARANDMWAQSLVLPGNVAGQITQSWSGISTDMVNGLSAGWTDTEGTFHDAVLLTSQGVQNEFKADNGIHSPSSVYREMGWHIVEGLTEGINKNKGYPERAILAVSALIIGTARNRLDPGVFEPIGAGISQGIANGIESELDRVESAVQKIVDLCLKAATSKKGLDERSPSHKFMKIGEYVSEGLAIGIDNKANEAVNSVTNLSNSTIDAMKYTIATIASTIQDGIEDPVITPVLDLSKVQAGVRTINSSFSASQALGAQSALAGLQNGEYVGNGNVIFNQNNYSPKALSRIEIYRDTRNLFAQAKGALS